LQLRLHRQGVAPVQYVHIWHMVTQGNATDATQAVQGLLASFQNMPNIYHNMQVSRRQL